MAGEQSHWEMGGFPVGYKGKNYIESVRVTGQGREQW